MLEEILKWFFLFGLPLAAVITIVVKAESRVISRRAVRKLFCAGYKRGMEAGHSLAKSATPAPNLPDPLNYPADVPAGTREVFSFNGLMLKILALLLTGVWAIFIFTKLPKEYQEYVSKPGEGNFLPAPELADPIKKPLPGEFTIIKPKPMPGATMYIVEFGVKPDDLGEGFVLSMPDKIDYAMLGYESKVGNEIKKSRFTEYKKRK